MRKSSRYEPEIKISNCFSSNVASCTTDNQNFIIKWCSVVSVDSIAVQKVKLIVEGLNPDIQLTYEIIIFHKPN